MRGSQVHVKLLGVDRVGISRHPVLVELVDAGVVDAIRGGREHGRWPLAVAHRGNDGLGSVP